MAGRTQAFEPIYHSIQRHLEWLYMRGMVLAAAFAAAALSRSETYAQPSTLSAAERAEGFRLLFNGRDLRGWEAPGKNWAVTDGAIAWVHAGGHLYYTAAEMPDSFDLRFEWKVAKGSNSGVYYRPGQYEYQILDNENHPDGRNPLTRAAALYAFAGPTEDATRPVGEWNEGRVVCHGTIIEHWLNGKRVLYIDYTEPRWTEAIARLKERGGDIAARGGRLLLQDHGDPVWYRSIRIRSGL